MESFFLLILSLFVVIQGASLATRYSEKVAESYHLSHYLVGFIIVSFISILPETFIAIGAALQGNASLGIGTLFGSNVADLTLIFAILAFIAGKRGIKVEKGMMRKLMVYPMFLMIPLLLGLDGAFTRAEGITLIIIGIIFYVSIFRNTVGMSVHTDGIRYRFRNMTVLVLSMAILLVGAHFTVESAISFANNLGVNATLIGVLVISLGTTIPELFFSAKAIKRNKHALAIGDILGSALADATIVVGIVALINPITFPERIAYVAGGFMVVASLLIVTVMKSRLKITRTEAVGLIMVWLIYAATEIVTSVM